MASPSRTAKVEAGIQRELATLLLQEVRDPRLQSVFVSAVDLSADLSSAKVYVQLEDADVEAALAALDEAKGFLRKRLASALPLRVSPNLYFKRDQSPQHLRRIESLLAKTHGNDAKDD